MNFLKVIRMAIRYRLTFISSIVCALIVAVFWGGNIGAVYPIVAVILQSETPQHWVEEKISDSKKTIAEKTAEIENGQKEILQADSKQQNKLNRRIEISQKRVE